MNNLKNKKVIVPKATIKRLPLYLRYLNLMFESGQCKINSFEFSQLTQVSASTIRKDFSYFGELGKSGYGYDVKYLMAVFNHYLRVSVYKNIAVIGVGNFGRTLINYNFKNNPNLNIIAGFDVDSEKQGQIINHKMVYPVDEFSEKVKKLKICATIITTPNDQAQEAANLAVENGITAILNFTSEQLRVPPEVSVKYIDLTLEMQALLCFDENRRQEYAK